MPGAKRLVIDEHMRVMSWASPRVLVPLEHMVPGIGIGLEQDGELIAGAVFTRITSVSAEFHMAAVPGKTWGTRHFFRMCAAYPFNQLGLRRVTATIREFNHEARKALEHLGFQLEGRMRQACRDGSDMLLYGILKDECRWAKP